MTVGSDLEWNIDMEVNLFHAMRGHKPAGVNRHFQMIAIHDKLSSSARKVTSNDVWLHLSTLYDLQALNESEIVPFPNKSGEFALLDKEMLDMCSKSFPRSSYISTVSIESTKTDGSGKNISKLSSKQESKTPKTEPKSEQKPSSTSKTDSRFNTPSGRSESKSSHHNSSSVSSSSSSSKSSHQTSSAPSPSPKRTKRTRHNNSASASPATPSEPQPKRRR